MPPPALVDPATFDFSKVVLNREQIAALIPQRYEFALLDAAFLLRREDETFGGYYDVTPDAWWTRGHVPGRPLLPGVLMIEAAAQLSAVFAHHALGFQGFMGFGGVEDVKFRGAVEPPSRFVIIGKKLEFRPRRIVSQLQGFVGMNMVFEGVVTGMPI